MNMTHVLYALFGLSILSLVLIMVESRVYRLVIYAGVFSLIISLVYLVLGSPDVAMAEAAIGAFAIIFFIVVSEKFYGKKFRTVAAEGGSGNKDYKRAPIGTYVLAALFLGGVGFMFVRFLPTGDAVVHELGYQLRDAYLYRFQDEIGGQNPIAAILMSYRIYDTLFEALLLVLAVTAVTQLSVFPEGGFKTGQDAVIKKDKIIFYSIRIISPLVLLFGVYLIINGHISAGGGFQGGVAVAAFFICRYMIHSIYDLDVKKILRMEEIVFMVLTIVAVVIVFVGADFFVPDTELGRTIFQNVYLILANGLVGLKVACGFFIIFYRYVAVERRNSEERT